MLYQPGFLAWCKPSLTRPFRITTYKDCGIRGKPKTHALSFGGSKRETRVPPPTPQKNKQPIYGMIKINLHLLFIPKRPHLYI